MLIKITEHPQIIETDGITQDKAKQLFRAKALIRIISTNDSPSPVTMKQISEVSEESWKLDMGGNLGELPSDYKVNGYLDFKNIPGHLFETTLNNDIEYATYLSDFRKVSIKKYEDSENVVVSNKMYESEITKPCPTTVITGDNIVPLYKVPGAVFRDECSYGLRHVDKIILAIKAIGVKIGTTVETEKALNGNTATITKVEPDDWSLVHTIGGKKIGYEIVDSVIYIKVTDSKLEDKDVKRIIEYTLKPKDTDIGKYINKVLKDKAIEAKKEEAQLVERISESRKAIILKYQNLDNLRTEIQRIESSEITVNINNPHIDSVWIEDNKLIFTTVLLNVKHTPADSFTEYNIRLGKFHVTVDMNTGSIKALNMTRRVNAFWNSASSFHIAGDGTPCLGTFADIANEAIGLCKYEELIDMTVGMICSINEDDYAGQQWYKWLEGSEADKFNNTLLKCNNCGTAITGSDYASIDDEIYCEDCYASCSECGGSETMSDLLSSEEDYWCDECAAECDKCGKVELKENLSTNAKGERLCDDCSCVCETCGSTDSQESMTNINGDMYCDDCIRICDICDDAIKEDEAIRHEGLTLCSNCYDERVTKQPEETNTQR